MTTQCITPITLGADRLTKNGFILKSPNFLGKIVGSPLGSVIEDVTPDSAGNDIGRRKIAVKLAAPVCGDLTDCVDPCTYDQDFDGIVKPILKDFETNCIGIKPIQLSQKDFTNLLNCDFQDNAWQGYFASLQKNLAAKLDVKVIEELDARVGAYANGGTTTQQLTLFGTANGQIQPLGVTTINYQFQSLGWNVAQGDLILVGDMAALVAQTMTPLQQNANQAGQVLSALGSSFDVVFDANISSVTGDPNMYYVLHREAFRILFFSSSKEFNRQLNGQMVQLRDLATLKTYFTTRTNGVHGASRIETFFLMPVQDSTGRTMGSVPVNIIGIYDNKCDKWNVFMSVEYLVITDLQVSCSQNNFNGILKYEHCAFELPTCTNTPVTPPTPPTPKCMPDLTCLPIQVNSIQIYNGLGGTIDIPLLKPITITATEDLELLSSIVAPYGGAWNVDNLCFVNATAVGFNGGTAYALV